jgi:multidrug transporter EmrE-like cation transporter
MSTNPAVASVADGVLASSSLSNVVSSLSSNPQVIGAAWLASSSILSTWTTTKFLKFKRGPFTKSRRNSSVVFDDQNAIQGRNLQLLLRSHVEQFFSLPPASMLNLYRFAGSLFLATMIPDFAMWQQKLRDTFSSIPAMALPATFLFIANFANSIALERIGISLTYTFKGITPILTVIGMILLDGRGALPNRWALASLLPIAVGVGAASWSSPTWESFGVVAAVISATAQSALSISSKRTFSKQIQSNGILSVHRTMMAVALMITVMVNLLQVFFVQNQDGGIQLQEVRAEKTPPLWLTISAVVSYHMEYILSFSFVKLVHPITYGTCDAVRMLIILLTGRAFFGGTPLAKVNMFGIALAMLGAISYSIASAK